ncbi:Hypothetical predicted protein [Olea europaea subsp. europaea]|uniref:Uncharacterized protein n=1 Tax=Olea europaea subsp. europaea TaxID=158383 RepID=A0A8S0RCP5_OLEEU|nr:Hypothetical predicted protein [Olea europaea subsp. europaea]
MSAGSEEEVKRNEMVRKSKTEIVREPKKSMEPRTERLVTRSEGGMLWLRPEITAMSSLYTLNVCVPSGKQNQRKRISGELFTAIGIADFVATVFIIVLYAGA